MVKTIAKIDGMACSMCEAHVNDAVRAAFDVKKVKSSHRKGTLEITSAGPIDAEKLKLVLADHGYKVLDVKYDGGDEQ